ncbi:MAG: SH3 domain-containing protein, partial [Treponema sp.]|nr:SH3 domain-containing protein [Treponema sp.]
LKSNIMQEYVIDNPNTEAVEKIEVPFSALSTPMSKKKALERAAKYRDYEHQYAKCVLDGLPIREAPENGSKQVYRLRQDEIIRTLYKGDGVIPTNGKELLKGDWLRVITKGGTAGWCFSQNLRLFTMNSDGTYGDGAEEAEVQAADDELDLLLASVWYPDYYQKMISSREIDLDYFSEDYRFDTGSSTGEVILKLFNVDESYPYAGVTKLRGGVYRFNGTQIQVTVKGKTSIVLQYTDSSGKPRSFGFVTLGPDTDIASLIKDEKERRQSVINDLAKFGPEFFSSAYGTLSVSASSPATAADGGTFSWTDYELVVPSLVSRNSGKDGTVAVRNFIGKALKKDWDGVLTFKFDKNGSEVNLLYKKASGGLRLAPARIKEEEDSVTGRKVRSVTASSSPLVMFFQTAAAMSDGM